jgi:hypothetical protein
MIIYVKAFWSAQQLLFSVNEEKEKTIELAEDLVAIVTSFAAKNIREKRI